MTSSSPDPILVTAQTYEREAAGWHNHTATDRSAWRPSYDTFLPLIPPGGRILDLGCGSGEDSPALTEAGNQAVGLDISEALLQMARSHEGLAGRVVRGDLRALPFADATFDGVWADGSLHHVAKQMLEGVLSEVRRVLRKGGAVAASVERGDTEGFVDHDGEVDGPRWYAHYQPGEIRQLFTSSGFDILDQFVAPPSAHSTNGFIVTFARKP